MKTEDEIAREKELVQKMVGAKSAMETAIKRIERLELVLGMLDRILSDMAENVGDRLYVKTYQHGESDGSGTIKTIPLRKQISYARSIVEKVK